MFSRRAAHPHSTRSQWAKCKSLQYAIEVLECRLMLSGKLFGGSTTVAVGSNPSCIAQADFNRDGSVDLAVANYASGNITVILNGANGTSFSRADYDANSNAEGLVAADFNGDGKPDLAIANDYTSTVSVLINNGNGSFGAKSAYFAGSYCNSVAAADYNGDGTIDLAVANGGDANSVSILLNNGNGSFASGVPYAAGLGATAVASADFNGDGNIDLAVVDYYGNAVSVLLNSGNGSFPSKTEYVVNPNSFSVVIGDFDNDGESDLAVGSFNTVSVLRNNGNGTFAPKMDYSAGSYRNAVAAADFNGDGKLDLALANNDLSILINNGDGTFAPKQVYLSDSGATAVTAANLNADGRMDLAIGNQGSNSVTILTATRAQRVFALSIGQHEGLFIRGDKGARAVFDALSTQPTWASVTEGNPTGPLVFQDTFQPGIRETVLSQLNAMQVQPGDTFVFYFNGHGGPDSYATDPGNETPVEIDGKSNSQDEFLSIKLDDDDLKTIFSSPKWEGVRKIFLIDACHSGGFIGTAGTNDVGDLEKLKDYALFASATEAGLADKSYTTNFGMGIWTQEMLLPALAQVGLSCTDLKSYFVAHLPAVVSQYAGEILPLLDLNSPGATATFTTMSPTDSEASDFDGSASLIPPGSPGDANDDGITNSIDFTILAAHFGQVNTVRESGDFNGDGVTNALDFNTLASNFGTGVGSRVTTTTIPAAEKLGEVAALTPGAGQPLLFQAPGTIAWRDLFDSIQN